MATGTVKRYDDAKGFGFITPNEGIEEIFFHVATVRGDASALKPGQRVEFDLLKGPKGQQAENVRAIENESPAIELGVGISLGRR
jgi:CspA family cold shock protein